jgi:Rap1a immunity proteins
MRRKLLLSAMALALPWSGANAADLQDFEVTSVTQLADLCGASPDDALYVEAIQFCYGYISGAAQFHNAVVGKGGLKPVACPTRDATRSEFAQYFVSWARGTATREQLAEPAVQGVARAAAARWPCAQ